MWKFLSGVSKPDKTQTKGEKRQYQREYEKSKRTRHFASSWQVNRPWLIDDIEGMKCNFCVNFAGDRNSSFVIGCQSYKLDSVLKHEKSKVHERCVLLHNARENPREKSKAAKIIETLNSDIIEKLSKLFRTCHGMVVHNRPISDFSWMCDLLDVLDVNIGNTYRNAVSAKGFIKCISDVEFQKVAAAIIESPFVCLIGDGSTDAAIKEQELWFVRTCINGNIQVHFIGIHSPERATSVNIVDGVKQIVDDNLKLPWSTVSEKLVALSCDGASVMTGCKSGVATLMRQDQPSLLTIHCMAHRLELALKDAAKQVKLYDKFCTLLMELYYFYHNSVLNRSMLCRCYDALKNAEDRQLHVPTRVGGTRWIGHQLRALTALSTSYRFIVAHLEQLKETSEKVSSDSKAKAVAFLRLLKSKDIICFMLFLQDMFAPLRRLSMMFQERACVLAKQHSALISTLEIIKKYQESDGPNLRVMAENSNSFKDTSLTHPTASEFQAARKKITSNILGALERRFADLSEPNVVQATRIADLMAMPQEWELLKAYGDKELEVIMTHFKTVLATAGFEPSEAEVEWMLIKKEIYEVHMPHTKRLEWVDIIRRGDRKCYKNIFMVINLVLAMSPSSSEAERGFSQMKLIKTTLRNKLSQGALNACLGIKLLSPSIKDFDPSDAIRHWNCTAVRPRRPTFKDKTSMKPSHLSIVDLEKDAADVSVPDLEAADVPDVEAADVEAAAVEDDDVEAAGVEAADLQDDVDAAGAPDVMDEDYFSDSGVDSDLDEDYVFEKLLC